MSEYKKSRFTVDLPLKDSKGEFIAVYHTLTRAYALLPQRNWNALLTGQPESALDHGAMESLHKQGFLVPKGADEMAVFEAWRHQYVHDFTSIMSKVLVTRRCNNRCAYCIVDAEAKDMTPETAQAMDRFYLNHIREKRPQLVIDDFSGGEMMLNWKVVKESATRRYYFCAGRDIEYKFSIISNGTLLNPAVISSLKEVGLSGVRVSVAGPAQVHDRLRPSRNNGKTYELIMQNLQAISGIVPIRIECQYDSGSTDYERIPEMMDDFHVRGIDVGRIDIIPIFPKRGRVDFRSGMGDPAVWLSLMREAERRGYPFIEQPPSNACLSDFRSRIVFDTDGTLIPCAAMQGGEMAYGDVFNGIDFVAHSQVLKRKFSSKCLDECEILPLCMGGCRLQALERRGDFNGVECNYDALKLVLTEYMRSKAEPVLCRNEGMNSLEAA